MIFKSTQSFKGASIFLGVFFCLLASASSEKSQTPDWQQEKEHSTEANQAQGCNVLKKTPAQSSSREKGDNVRFLAYNLKNYLTMRRYAGEKITNRSKPEREISSLISIIKNAKPDILGVCEIGTPEDLANLQSRLKKAGLNLPHSHRTYGGDPVRALAVLSRYPIVSWALPEKADYRLEGRPFKMSRGILDVTIQLPNKRVRFLGAHLKSKRPIKEADQEMMRRNESLLLRKHIESILSKCPEAALMAYGDFNDTKRSKAIYTVKGRFNSDSHMKMLELSDSRGETWTHHWKLEDVYSRFDYVMVSKHLAPWIDLKASSVLNPDDWEQASDHRPMLIIIR